jgi:hypothetical protein
MGTRFDSRNAAKQCAFDNIYLEGPNYEFSIAIDKKYGKGTAAELYRLSKTITQLDERQLGAIARSREDGIAGLQTALRRNYCQSLKIPPTKARIIARPNTPQTQRLHVSFEEDEKL